MDTDGARRPGGDLNGSSRPGWRRPAATRARAARCLPAKRGPVREQPQRRVALQEHFQGDASFQAGQGCADAVVDAAAERDVAALGALDVEPLRDRRIPPGRGSPHRWRGWRRRRAAAWNAVYLAVLQHGPNVELHRRVEAQQLLHRSRYPARVFPQKRELLRVPQQRQHAVADQVRGGLVAGNQQQAQHQEHLALGEGISLLFRLGEGADDVVPGVAAPGLNDGHEVGVERLAGGNGPLLSRAR